MRQASREHRSGAALADRLRERRAELEEAILTRVYAVSEPPDAPEYIGGLHAAVSAALDYGMEGIERGQRSDPQLPDALLAQARLAARSGVNLDTILRRYFAGYTLLEDFVVQEAERELGPAALKRLLRSQAALVDRLLEAVSGAYAKEAERRWPVGERRKAEQVERALAGELIDASGLGYSLESHHLGIVAFGRGAGEAVKALAKRLDTRLLVVSREEGILWAWLGSRCRLVPEEVAAAFVEQPADSRVGIGEPGAEIAGWRLTHRQARAALSVALRGEESAVRYSDVALLALAFGDDLLATSLRQLYLAPLAAERDGGTALRQTLRAYFAAERNVSSTAASMGADRKTVASRLRTAERLLGRAIATCAPELETALRVAELETSPSQIRESNPHISPN